MDKAQNQSKKGIGNWIVYAIAMMTIAMIYYTFQEDDIDPGNMAGITLNDTDWVAPSLYTDNRTKGPERELIVYGEDLVAHTAKYFGPSGSIGHTTNGMNCQNCHLSAGRKPWAINFGAVASTYPKLRSRSGTYESIPKRVNDCFERSLNGIPLDTNTREMKAMVAYIEWVGKDVPKGKTPNTTGIPRLGFIDRAADPLKGKSVYDMHCMSCHGQDGQGQQEPGNPENIYPPLWGPHSYNSSAGLYRLSNFAGFVKSNMPFNVATHSNTTLSTEEAWDVAAFVNSQPRPAKPFSGDWPDVSKKPFDHPFGPYADGFSEKQHKYGPYQPIADARGK